MADGMAFIGGFNSAYRMMQEREERKRQEEANKQLGQLYFDMASKDAYKAVQPYEANAIQSQDDAFRKQMIAESSAMTDSLMANNPNFTQRIQGQTAPVTPEQAPALQQQFQQTNQANLSQANNQAQSAEQMLAMAKEKYGTDMFDKMQPYIGKIPSDKLIGIVNNMQAKAQQQADKLALNSAMAVFGRKDASDDEKKQAAVTIATLKPELGKMFQNFFVPKDSKLSIAPDGRVVDMRTGLPVQNTPVYAKPEKEKPAAGTWILQTNPDGSQSRINSVTGQVINVSPPKETMIQTPFGPMKNTDLLAKIESVRPKEIVTTDDFGNKVTKKDGNAELYNQLMESLKAHQNKQNPTANSAGNTPTVTMDMVKESITKQGAEMTKKKLMSAGIPEKEAESWINRAANWN